MSKKLTLFFLFFLIAINFTKAQNWGGGIDDERVNFGFRFQYISSEFKITKKKDWRQPYYDEFSGTYATDSLSSISSPTSVGFGIGFVINGKITSNLDLRFTPLLVFEDRSIIYNYAIPGAYNPSSPLIQKKVSSTIVDFPIGLKLKSDRLMNFRAYMLGGLKYSLDLASGKKNNDENAAPKDKLLKNKGNFLSYEAGLGFDLYFEYFKMSPEIKLSYSIGDILKHDNTPFANPIDKAKLRHFTFSLFFE
jgi:hypothetical protein